MSRDPNGLNYSTSYGYDALDDLTSVAQSSQSRQFPYDSLGRLSSALNPESGTLCYGTVNSSTGACQPAGGYDGNGNLLQKSFKIAYQQSTGTYTSTVVTQAYDKLNRLIQKTYSDGTTPTVTLCYDGNTSATSASGSPAVTCTGASPLSGVNARRRLTWASNANFHKQLLGFRLLRQGETAQPDNRWAAPYPVSYSYNEVGLTQETYPSGRTVTMGYDRARVFAGWDGELYGRGLVHPVHGAQCGDLHSSVDIADRADLLQQPPAALRGAVELLPLLGSGGFW